MVRFFTLAALFSLLAAPAIGQSADGIFMTQRVTSGGEPITVQVHIDATRMRTEMVGPNGATNVTIFDGGKQVLYIIDPARKTYTEMTKADVDRVGAQLQGATADIQSQLEKLPPAQRADIQAMMKGVELRRTGTDKAGRWTCDKYDVILAGQKIGERCTVNLAVLGFTAMDFGVMGQMGAFYSAMAPQMAGQVPGPSGIDPGGSSDFPVKTVMMLPGAITTTELIEAGRQTLSDSLFAVPAGFTRQDAGPLGGRDTAPQR
jgi:hypothetical protein